MSTKKGTNKSETLQGTGGNDNLLGRAGDDTLFGGGGNDRLDGGQGDDELLGGDGNDLLLPGRGGFDAMDGGKGIDTVSYANYATTAGITIQLNPVGESPHADAEGDTFLNVERFIGTKAADFFYIYRHDVADGYYVFGGDGDDFIRADGGVMRGGAGNNTMHGDSERQLTDTFWLDLDGGVDRIFEFTHSQDRLRISGKEFGIGALLNSDEFIFSNTATAVGKNAQFIFQSAEQKLYFDADGSGGEAAVHLVTFEGTPDVTLNEGYFEIV